MEKTTNKLNKYSSELTQDPGQPASQAMLYGTGLSEEDMAKAQVGIAAAGYEGNTCNMHLNALAAQTKAGVMKAGMVGMTFHTIGVSDGIANGKEGMRYSLVSREIIADSIEAVMGAQYYDGLLALMGCDKNMPGSVLAMTRVNRPSIMIYGGTVASGKWKGESLNIVSAFEAYGKKLNDQISEEDYQGIIQNSIPGAGACGGMYTANTMASAIETLGLSLPYSSSNPAMSPEKKEECQTAGAAIRKLLEIDLKPSNILSRASFENAVTFVMATGGSTNAVLHLLAMAKTAGVALSLKDFQDISDRTPLLADLKPSGQYLMEDLHAVGGTPAIQKLLLAEGLLDGSCMTVTGNTLAENLEELPGLKEGQKLMMPVDKPLKETAHLQILYGNLAENGAVAKITGKEGERFEGPAIVFDSEFDMIKGVEAGRIKAGQVIVIRYSGPKGAPGMPEMLKPTSTIMGAGLGKEVALITDGRFSGGSHGFVVGHICPEAQEGGNLCIVQDGDTITLDAVNNRIEVDLSAEEIAERKSRWTAPELKEKLGVLRKYAKTVGPASEGCLTDI